ncbi:uncharacterized protein (DUF427 family) [Williamsia limnetica]|jgi:uncharacterized protein (DUF427 family)|uniref:Uncharacterized protein (DUF427 family) n=1 Tax=Williamsia limnetica TaxID=882452 RepID=A0A318RJH8_WILLI|nr:DUF427 domain-containing protein [Williamsia limnetica]PYE18000.1 uncharacterized protein (DUF427 family) [Williamsia limnetica]
MAQARLIPDDTHPITVEASTGQVRVRAGETIVVDTAKSLVLQESTYPPVAYVPLAAIDPALLRPSDTETYCPYKGNASYYDLITPDGVIEDAAWTYAEPYDAVSDIAGHLAFYPSKVVITIS